MHNYCFAVLQRTWRIGVVAFSCLMLVACDAKIDLYSGLSEADANHMVVALSDMNIECEKVSMKQGFSVKVREADLSSALTVLNQQSLPRSSFARMGDVFKKDGMISTPTEEKGRYLFALSQELENTLSQIDGVLLARVHPVLPERIVPGEPVTPSSCSVFIKHRPGWDADAFESRIKKLVIAGIPGLARTKESGVSIIFVATENDAMNAAHAKSISTNRPTKRGLWIGVTFVFVCTAMWYLLGGGTLLIERLQRWKKR